MTPIPSARDLIAEVTSDTGTDDPLAQLSQAATSMVELEAVGDAVVGHFVDRCRASGCTWTQISDALGVTRQAAHKRFAGGPTFDRFTPRARQVLADAIEEARQTGDDAAEPEHLVLALYRQPESVAAQILVGIGVTRDDLRGGFGLADDRPTPCDLGLGTGSTATLRRAVDEALRLGHNYVGTEHLLLASVLDPDRKARFANLGLTHDAVEERFHAIFEELRRAHG